MDSIRNYLTLICSLPTSDGTSPLIKFRNYSVGFGLFLIVLTGLISSAAYFIKFIADDLEKSFYALFQVAGLTSVTYMISVGYLMKHNIQNSVYELEKIRNDCKRKKIIFSLFLKNRIFICFSFHKIKIHPTSLI